MLPDVSDVLTEWEVPVRIKTVTRTTVDFEPVNTVAGRTIDAVVQTPQKERLQTVQIDFSLKYQQLHSKEPVYNGEYLEYNGKDYKVIDDGDWQSYGYTDAVCESTNEPLIVETA